MYYYKRHIGDYVKKTAHLSPLEHGVYNLILDSYYDREQGPTALEANRWARARTEEERQAVTAVLEEFFEQGYDGRYRNDRVEDELQAYRAMAESNRIIAIAREEKKRLKREGSTEIPPTVARDEHEACEKEHEPFTVGAPNQEPLTNNTSSSEQSPDTQKRRKWGTEEDHLAAQWIFSLVRKLNADAKEPNWDGWANDIRLMRESDKRDHRQICDLFKRANADTFWQSNILSPAKLREKWDQLVIRLSSMPVATSAAEISAGWK